MRCQKIASANDFQFVRGIVDAARQTQHLQGNSINHRTTVDVELEHVAFEE